MEATIKTLKQLFVCEQFVVTGSYAMRRMGFTNTVKDLNIILVNPIPTTKEILKTMSIPQPVESHYPTDPDHYNIDMSGVKVDVWVRGVIVPSIALADGFEINQVRGIIDAKKSFHSLKHLIQRKVWASLIYTHDEDSTFIEKEAHQYKYNGTIPKTNK